MNPPVQKMSLLFMFSKSAKNQSCGIENMQNDIYAKFYIRRESDERLYKEMNYFDDGIFNWRIK